MIPICPKCLLILCDVNVPYSRACPSCTFRPLVSDAILAEQIVKLESERDSITAKENERIRLESEEEERARRAIQFPELHDGRSISPAGGSSGSIDYARKAGAGPSHHQQVQQAYRNAQAREEAIAASGERRVLTLNSKTKKVQYQTIKPTKKSNAKATEALNKQKKPAKQDDLEDDRQPYIDENDDGLLKAAHIAGERTKTDYSWPPKQGSGITYVKRKTAIDAADPTEDDSEVSDVSDAESGQENNELPEGSTAT